jgi:pre-rRNA-processing protein TSR3
MTAESERSFPPTIVVVHRKERREKCSVEPLRGRADFRFRRYAPNLTFPTGGYVRLATSGPLLSDADRNCGLLILDATWRLAASMERDFATIPPRALPAWRTAYPRVSKLTRDPEHGLATVEAVYIAYLILGRDASGLLDAYPWRDDFFGRNRDRIAALLETRPDAATP